MREHMNHHDFCVIRGVHDDFTDKMAADQCGGNAEQQKKKIFEVLHEFPAEF